MADVKVQITGLNKLVRELKQAEQTELLAGLKVANKEAADVVKDAAQPLIPVLTGKLRGSLRSSATAKGGTVRVRTPYAAPIHWGWYRRHIKPQPFLYTALDSRRKEVIDRYEIAMAKVVEAFDNIKGTD